MIGPKQNNTCFPQGERGALQADAPKWDLNWSESDGRYLVEYYFTDDFSDEIQQAIIREKLEEYEQKTCIKMVEVDEPSYDYYDYDSFDYNAYRIRLVKGGGCWSYVGRWYLDQARVIKVAVIMANCIVLGLTSLSNPELAS